MASIANITVKNAAAADVVYTGVVPSAGDRSPAKWVATALSTIAGFRPWFSMASRDNGAKTARQIDLHFGYPIVQTIGGVETRVGNVPISASVLVPTNVDSAVPADAFVQFGNLLASTLIRQSVETGYSPT